MSARARVQAVREGDMVRLRLLRERRRATAVEVIRDPETSRLDRLLAAVASEALPPAAATVLVEQSSELTQAVVDLAGAQTGDVHIGAVAGRDVITVNIYVGGGEHERRP